MVQPLQGTKSAQDQGILRVHYTHDAMIDLILAHPQMSQGDLAKYFGYTEGWVSRVIGSDAFQARLASRKEEVVNPAILASIEEKIKGLAHQSLEVIQRKLDATQSPELAIKALDLSTKALGMGARPANVAQQNNTFVVALPPKAESESEWAAQARQKVEEHRQNVLEAQKAAIDVPSREVS